MKRTPLKRGKGFTAQSKPMKAVSAKRAAHRRSKEGQDGLDYMGRVRQLPCIVCGAYGVDAHHCKDIPPINYNKGMGPYKKLPSAGSKSSDYDTIPLCKADHLDGPNALHKGRRSWREKHGPDYSYIEATRRAVSRL